MSMLAERRSKTRYVLNPRSKPLWYQEDEGLQYGRQLMEKMGWSAGKGLGASEQGIQEPVRSSFKNDTKGLSFKGYDNTWIQHHDEFSSLLSSLSENGGAETTKEHSVQSLEEKSERSKARVHYHKFTRGKDLAKYSADDLACILGSKNKKKEEEKEEEVVEAMEVSQPGDTDTSFGVTTISGGSITDYFKMKYRINKVNIPMEVHDEDSENERPCFSQATGNGLTQSRGQNETNEAVRELSVENEDESYSKKKKVKFSDEKTVIDEKLSKRKKKKKEKHDNIGNENGSIEIAEKLCNFDEELTNGHTTSKKKKKTKEGSAGSDPEVLDTLGTTEPDCVKKLENGHIKAKKQKKKKNKDSDSGLEPETLQSQQTENGNEASENSEDCETTSKKQKKKKRKDDNISAEVLELPETETGEVNMTVDNSETITKKSKKKKRKPDSLPNSDTEVLKLLKTEEGDTLVNNETTIKKQKKNKHKDNLPVAMEEVETVEENNESFTKKKKKNKNKDSDCADSMLLITETLVVEDKSEKKKKKHKNKDTDVIQLDSIIEENTETLKLSKKRKKKSDDNQEVLEENKMEIEPVKINCKNKKRKHKDKEILVNESDALEEPENTVGSETKRKKKKQKVRENGDIPETEKNADVTESKTSEVGSQCLESKTQAHDFSAKGKSYREQLMKDVVLEQFKGANLHSIKGYGSQAR